METLGIYGSVYKELGQNSPFTPNKTTDDQELSSTILELLAWTPPDYMIQNFPYYFTGYSYEGRPVWIVEAGKFDMNHLVQQGTDMIEASEVTMEQAVLRVFKSMADVQEGEEVPRAEVIYDFDGANIKKFSQPQAIAQLFKIARRYMDLFSLMVENVIVINSNFFVEALLNPLRPVVGQLMERVEIYGSNKDKWIPRLRRLLPSSSLPPWYGGDPNFRPVVAYG